MKSYLLALSLAVAAPTLGQAPGAAAGAATNAVPTVSPEVNAKFKTTDERNGYVLGAMIAEDMVPRVRSSGFDGPNDAIARGFAESVNGKLVLSKEEMQQVFAVMRADAMKKQEEKRKIEEEKAKVEAEKNLKEGEAFLAANRTKEGVVTLPSGLQYKVLKAGDGTNKPASTDTVVVHYRGTLLDGKEFDSSHTRGTPARFALNRVIKGWTEGMQLMSVGAKWQLFIPADLAYGPTGSRPRIPGNSTLTFEVELLGIEGKTTNAPATSASGQPVTSDIIKVPSKAELEKGAKIEVIKASDAERLQKEREAQQKKVENK